MKIQKFQVLARKYITAGAFMGIALVVNTAHDSGSPQEEYATASSSNLVAHIYSPIDQTNLIKHINTPDSVKAVYMSSWVAATPSVREKLLKLIDETEINSVIIDVKDATGKISFPVADGLLSKIGSSENRIRDLYDLLYSLHAKGVYVIGRIAVFQDPYYPFLHHEVAIQYSDGTLWRDKKGSLWVDPAAQSFWEYIADISKEAYKYGFDEINYDYVRYPSDGNLSDMVLPVSHQRYKPGIINSFWSYIGGEMKKDGIPTSVDLFGMTTIATDDLGIGQIFEDALPNFDAISPMVYPSHYNTGFLGFSSPAAHPYEVMKHVMSSGIQRMLTIGSNPEKLRPWLQDFNYGEDYGPEKVRAQIQALHDIGLDSWMLWDPSNVYSKAALEPE